MERDISLKRILRTFMKHMENLALGRGVLFKGRMKIGMS